jgi:tRNA wybutosine-synthesizing protein 3
MIQCVPKKWELYGDLAIIPTTSFNSTDWQEIFLSQPHLAEKVWQTTAMCLNVSRLARQAEIADDKLRSSQVTMLLGNSGEVEFTDFGVKFWLDVTKVMFSSGNVTERHRIGSIDMTDEFVVDAFAGIGYYTLPMLVRSNAKHVYALELNPNSVLALNRGAKLNGVSDRLSVIQGDNQVSMRSLSGIADRVHLGILPSSESTWLPALECLKKSGGTLHIHMNVKENELNDFVDYCVEKLSDYAIKQLGFSHVSLNHLEKVKWYAPHVRHIVIDVAIQ